MEILCEIDGFQVFTFEERSRAERAERGGKVDGDDAGICKRLVAHLREPFRKEYALQRRGIAEHAAAHRREARGQFDRSDRGTHEHVVSDRIEAAAAFKGDRSQRGNGERVVADREGAGRDDDSLQRGADEGIIADDEGLCAARRKYDLSERRAPVERIVRDQFDGCGNGDFGQSRIACKGIFRDLRRAVGHGVFRFVGGAQIVEEHAVFQERNAVGNGVAVVVFAHRDLGKVFQPEGACVKGVERLGNAEGGEGMAVDERVRADGLHAVGQGDRGEPRIAERLCAHARDGGVIEVDLSHVCAVAERVGGDRFGILVDGHGAVRARVHGRAEEEFGVVLRVQHAFVCGIGGVVSRNLD